MECYLGLNALNGKVPPEIGNCGRLEKLALNGNKLTGPLPAALGCLSLHYFDASMNALELPTPVNADGGAARGARRGVYVDGDGGWELCGATRPKVLALFRALGMFHHERHHETNPASPAAQAKQAKQAEAETEDCKVVALPP